MNIEDKMFSLVQFLILSCKMVFESFANSCCHDLRSLSLEYKSISFYFYSLTGVPTDPLDFGNHFFVLKTSKNAMKHVIDEEGGHI